ncbi:GDP-L-fucose synthase [Nakamurella flavida]|uniref:GDP-L-fucose synthase n=1 Tax=Nakamurella flavida TaxID=363630 RepID=A0A938YRA7_9ACTN|nr:GDP-L-fucose synthase [Nakamurella flavida]MBM9477788.1 GDP-L-fucose synthase [Nakamurella flavida]MDP9779341.1 GDP-L-fucose synthase [Nakamurella flavida]
MTDTQRFPLLPGTRVYVAGHRGLAGSALWRALERRGVGTLTGRTSAELDLRDRDATMAFVAEARPDVIIDAAARVGGILANSTYPADFLSENLRIQVNLLDAARAVGVPRFLFLGSSCIYPKFAEQPIREDSLLTGPLEPTNDAYAIAKIAGILQIQAIRRQDGLPYISAMPTNLYGPGDNFHPTQSHVLPALIRRFDEAARRGDPTVTCWGSGTPRREFLHADDLADACLHLLEFYDDPAPINVGTGVDHTIAEIAGMVADTVGFGGTIEWDTGKPDGTPQKLLDVSRLHGTGWTSSVDLPTGLTQTYRWYQDHREASADGRPRS